MARVRVLAAMKEGAALHYELRSTGPCWFLSNGTPVLEHVAEFVILDRQHVVPVDRALFQDLRPQTWRWVENPRGEDQ
jgi:hypothetical protein